jgi:prepilin-type processing-associated H-X9-DG protein
MNKGFKTGIKLINGIIILSLLLANCGSSRELAITNSNLVRAAATKIPADFAAIWDKRHIEAESLKAVNKINELVKENPSSYEYLIIASRANYVYADGHLYFKMTEENEAAIKTEQKKHYDASIQFAEKAMALDPTFRTAVLGGTKVEEAINGLGKDYIDAIFWRYAALARWSRLEGTTTLLKNKGKFSQMVKRVEALDPNYFFGAVYRFYGGAETLSPAGSMTKGKENFEKAIKVETNYFGNHVLYADVWATKKGDVALFKKELNLVINAKPEVLGKPEWVPEQIIEQGKAKKIIQEIEARNLD